MPGIDSRAPDRTETRSGFAASPSLRPDFSSSRFNAASVWSHSPGGNWLPARTYALHAAVVMVNAGGTGSPACVIAARPAPLPPSRSRLVAGASSAMYTHCSVADPSDGAPVVAPFVTSTAIVDLLTRLDRHRGSVIQV